MNLLDHQSDSSFTQAIEHYATALQAIEDAAPHPSFEQVVTVLVARDLVEKIKQNSEEATGQNLARLIQLDTRLKAQSEVLTKQAQLTDCRESMQPSESAWWWYLDSSSQPELWWSRFDWFWNLLTVSCLFFAGTFATNTAQAFSMGGFDLIGTFSTITQGASLALVAGGALTEQGRAVVEKTLNSLKIPSWLHAEATFVAAGLVLLGSYSIHQNLPQIGEYYYQQGQNAEAENQWLVAKEKYERAQKFLPSAAKVQIGLGKVYERLGQLKDAQTYYEQAVLSNDMEARIRLGRVDLLQALQAARWTGKIEQEQLRNAEIYLELAEKNLTDEGKKNTTGTNPGASRQIQTQRLLVDVYMNQGILIWAKIGLEAPDGSTRDELLAQAESKFKKAADLEYYLPTIPAGRRAECYQKISTYIAAKVKTKNDSQSKNEIKETRQVAEDCSSQISRQTDDNLYDTFLMSRAMEAKLGMSGSGTPKE